MHAESSTPGADLLSVTLTVEALESGFDLETRPYFPCRYLLLNDLVSDTIDSLLGNFYV